MATRQLDARTAHLETLIALAQLLDRVEPNVATIGAEQYRALVRQIQQALGATRFRPMRCKRCCARTRTRP